MKNSPIVFRLSILLFFVSAFIVAKSNPHISFGKTDFTSLIGRWDMTLFIDGNEEPSWLEVQKSGSSRLIGQYVGSGGSARPIAKIIYNDGKMSFTIPPQWEKENNDLNFEGTLTGDSLSGTMTSADDKTYKWSAVRAPSLKRIAEPAWQQPVKLFDGNDLNGWHATGTNQWVAKNGVLQSPHSGSNIMTDQTFNDFKLHIEFRYPEGSNSGVYLRGRYEVQIEDDHGDEPVRNVFSSIYGFLEPTQMTAKKAGEWQTYDITLIGRMVTIVSNGVTVICNREIPGITGGAINSKEGEPGPILLQGDHGPIEFRNITIMPAK